MGIRIAPTIMGGWFYAIRAGYDTTDGRITYWVEDHEGQRRRISGQKYHLLAKRQVKEDAE
jgi:hypothetical protein